MIISSGCLLFSVEGVIGSVTDFDTFAGCFGELGDDDTVNIRVYCHFTWLLSVEAMRAEVAFTEANDVLVGGVMGI